MAILGRFFFYQSKVVRQRRFYHIKGWSGGDYPAPKTFFIKFGQASRVVGVAVSDKNKINLRRVESKFFVIQFLGIARALEQAAVNKNFFIAVSQQIIGAGYNFCSSVKSKNHVKIFKDLKRPPKDIRLSQKWQWAEGRPSVFVLFD